MTDVTQILSAIEDGDPDAAEQLLPLVYDELRKLAAQRLINEKPGQTLQATALVHEAYIKLVDVEKPSTGTVEATSSGLLRRPCGGFWWTMRGEKQARCTGEIVVRSNSRTCNLQPKSLPMIYCPSTRHSRDWAKLIRRKPS